MVVVTMNQKSTIMNISDTSTHLATSVTREEKTAKRLGYFIFTFGMVILTLSFLSSCNTTRGFGRDVQKVGNKIEREADRVQNSN